MPLYPYDCVCGRQWDEFSLVANRDSVVCSCGLPARRRMALDITTYMHPSERAINHGQGAKHKRWLDQPLTQQRIRDGELTPVPKARTPFGREDVL